MRQRLRKQFKRSPEPDEVRFEMARDKGYGGRSKCTKPSDNIMHRSRNVGVNAGLSVVDDDIPQTSRPRDGENPRQPIIPTARSAGRIPFQNESGTRFNPDKQSHEQSTLLSIPEEQIAQHPMVMKMM